MSLTLGKDGHLLKEEWTPPIWKDDVKVRDGYYSDVELLIQSEVLKNWNTYVKVQQGTTIRSIFLFLEKLDRIDAISDLTQNCWIDEFIEASKEKSEEEKDLDFAVFYKVFDESDYTYWPEFSGKKKNDEQFWAIDSLPMSELVNVPIVLSEDLFERYPDKKETKKQKWTLGEFLTAFLYNISFYGGPKETKEKMDGIREAVRRIESGEEKLIPFDFKEFMND